MLIFRRVKEHVTPINNAVSRLVHNLQVVTTGIVVLKSLKCRVVIMIFIYKSITK